MLQDFLARRPSGRTSTTSPTSRVSNQFCTQRYAVLFALSREPAPQVINPAAMYSGTELFFGYSTSIHALFTDLIYTNSYTCSTSLPPDSPAAS